MANFPQFSALHVWRIILLIFLAVLLALACMLWLSSARESKEAFDSGRRFLITIANGEVKGKQIDVPAEHPAPAANVPEADKLVQPAANAVPATNAALSETAPAGSLPSIGADGTKPWRYYAKTFTLPTRTPAIAIIVSGLGYNHTATEQAIKLPEAVSLSFSPYAKNVTSWVATARQAGHEIIMDLPLEPINYPASDPGPYGLLTSRNVAENVSRLKWLMAQCSSYIGFLTPQNDAFTQNLDALRPILQEFTNRGLLLILGHQPAKTDTALLITSSATPEVTADALVDEDLSAAAIQTRLSTLENVAKQRGYAIGIAQAFPLSLEQINLWAAHLAEKGVALAPISFIAKEKNP